MLFLFFMSLKVGNMSSPLIRENRHSDTVFKVRNCEERRRDLLFLSLRMYLQGRLDPYKTHIQRAANLLVIWSEHDPAAETVAYVNDSSAADETDDIRERCSKGQDENLPIDGKYQGVEKKKNNLFLGYTLEVRLTN